MHLAVHLATEYTLTHFESCLSHFRGRFFEYAFPQLQCCFPNEFSYGCNEVKTETSSSQFLALVYSQPPLLEMSSVQKLFSPSSNLHLLHRQFPLLLLRHCHPPPPPPVHNPLFQGKVFNKVTFDNFFISGILSKTLQLHFFFNGRFQPCLFHSSTAHSKSMLPHFWCFVSL